MIVRRFDDLAAMQQEAVVLLKQHFAFSCTDPHAVMLTGGKTPRGLYKQIEESSGLGADGPELCYCQAA